MNKEIDTSAILAEDPYMTLGILEPTQIKEIDPLRRIYQLGKDSPVLIEGLVRDGSHEYLAKIILQEEIPVMLENIGRNIRNPAGPTNVVGTFRYDLNSLVSAAKHAKGPSYKKPPLWTIQATPVEMFFTRQAYIGVDYRGAKPSDIAGLHVIANLSRDPRPSNRNPSKNFRFRHHQQS